MCCRLYNQSQKPASCWVRVLLLIYLHGPYFLSGWDIPIHAGTHAYTHPAVLAGGTWISQIPMYCS